MRKWSFGLGFAVNAKPVGISRDISLLSENDAYLATEHYPRRYYKANVNHYSDTVRSMEG